MAAVPGFAQGVGHQREGAGLVGGLGDDGCHELGAAVLPACAAGSTMISRSSAREGGPTGSCAPSRSAARSSGWVKHRP